ncbi:hypothetical protein V8E36_008440 [Tilletia maclaganii]
MWLSRLEPISNLSTLWRGGPEPVQMKPEYAALCYGCYWAMRASDGGAATTPRMLKVGDARYPHIPLFCQSIETSNSSALAQVLGRMDHNLAHTTGFADDSDAPTFANFDFAKCNISLIPVSTNLMEGTGMAVETVERRALFETPLRGFFESTSQWPNEWKLAAFECRRDQPLFVAGQKGVGSLSASQPQQADDISNNIAALCIEAGLPKTGGAYPRDVTMLDVVGLRAEGEPLDDDIAARLKASSRLYLRLDGYRVRAMDSRMRSRGTSDDASAERRLRGAKREQALGEAELTAEQRAEIEKDPESRSSSR